MKSRKGLRNVRQQGLGMERRLSIIRKYGSSKASQTRARLSESKDVSTNRRVDDGIAGSELQEQASSSNILLEQQPVSCSACDKLIQDRFLLKAANRFWHEECLRCDHCHESLIKLGPSFFEKSNTKLCSQDYSELHGQKSVCSVCNKMIFASEMVMRAKSNVYHLECFACQLCGLRFCVGDRFYLCEDKIVCQFDYDEHIVPIQKCFYQMDVWPHGQDKIELDLADNQSQGCHTTSCQPATGGHYSFAESYFTDSANAQYRAVWSATNEEPGEEQQQQQQQQQEGSQEADRQSLVAGDSDHAEKQAVSDEHALQAGEHGANQREPFSSEEAKG